MNEFCAGVLFVLVCNGLVLTFMGLSLILIQRLVAIKTPQLRRFLWFAVIVQGCVIIRIPVTSNWLVAFTRSSPHHSVDSDSNLSWFTAELARSILLTESNSPTSIVNTPESPTTFPWAVLIASLWIVGMGVMAIRAYCQYRWFIRNLPSKTVVPAEWLEELNSLQAHPRHQVSLRLTENLGPLLCWHPEGYQLIVPTGVWRLLQPRQRLMILRHELSHLERGDLWKSLAVRLLALPHWFNPVAWWVIKRFDDDAECACDDAIHQAGPDSVIDYARTLLMLGGSHSTTFLTAQAKGGHGLADRIRRLIVPNSRKDSNMKKIAIVVLALGISTLPLLRLQSQAEDQSTTSKASVPLGETVESQFKSGFADYDATIVIGTSSQATPSSTASQKKQAVIDVALLLQNLLELAYERGRLTSLREEHDELYRKQIDANTKGNTAESINFDKIRMQKSQVLFKKMQEVHHVICQKVNAEVTEYAKANGIRLVRNRKNQTASGSAQPLPALMIGQNTNVAGTRTLTVTNAPIFEPNRPGGTPPLTNTSLFISSFGTVDSKVATNEAGKAGTTVSPPNVPGMTGFNIIAEVANEFTQMLQKDVLFVEAADEVDITSQILESLNKKYRQEHPND